MTVTPELVIAIVSAVLSVVAGALSTRAARRAKQFEFELERRRRQEDAAEAAERVLRLYRDPLLDAAHTLQSRLYNIVAQDLLGRFLNHDNPEERRYVRDYTVFAIAEYLCWVEIVRRELRFLDLGDVKRNRDFLHRLIDVQHTFQTSSLPPQFRVFRGRQRAIAELMMIASMAQEGPRTECLGYAAFCRKLDTDEEFASWFVQLRADVDIVATAGPDDNVRLTVLQRQLMALIDFLDPHQVRLAPAFRQSLPEPATAPALTKSADNYRTTDALG